jgi:2-dehydro-3-deoxyphosphogluconate aldolase/(4S)-4-hydroxy-2-oxoglutarate aldolase
MAGILKHEVLGKLLDSGLLPVFYNDDLEISKKIVKACADGGAKVVEFTNRGDFAYLVFTELAKWCKKELPNVTIGVGTIMEPETAGLYINCGAKLIVAPTFNPEVAKICNRRKVPYVPGCLTPTEISNAEEMGVDVIKVFPGSSVGPHFIKSVLGPMASSKLMPSGGVEPNKDNIAGWIKAGAACLNMGSNLVSKELVEKGDFEGITKLVAQCVSWIREARGTPVFSGIEHVGLYPRKGKEGAEIAKWYSEIFGFDVKEGNTSIFTPTKGPRIEVMKAPECSQVCHLAIYVNDFERACAILKDKGIELEEPILKPGTKAVFLKKSDPAGNRVHIVNRY